MKQGRDTSPAPAYIRLPTRDRESSMRRLLFTFCLGAVVIGTGAAPAFAHPLGNFTINHYVGLHIEPSVTTVTFVLDFAEIPTFQIRRDLSESAELSQDQIAGLATSTCADATRHIDLASDGTQIVLTAAAESAEFLPGQGDLDTLRITCRFEFPTPDQFPSTIEIADRTFSDRVGWREIVITSEGVDIESEALTSSPTNALRSYVSGSSIRDDRTAAVTLVQLGPGTGPDVLEEEPDPATATLIDRIGGVLSAERLETTPIFLAVAAALGLGFAHALAPGHGKTLVAAYLVGNRGTWRHAVGLGFTVAVSHTVGVAALGVVTLLASSAFEPAAVYPILATLSGVIVFGMGVYLVIRSIRSGRARRSIPEHDHPDSDHGHSHSHDHAHGHTHELPQTITWRGLVALGVSGGLVPSASAVVLLLGAISLGRTGLGVLLVALFGVGMSAALVGTGLLVVGAERLGSSLLTELPWLNTLRKALPVVMAWVVLFVGALLIYNATRAFTI